MRRLEEPGMRKVHLYCNTRACGWRQADQELKANFSYVVSLRPAQALSQKTLYLITNILRYNSIPQKVKGREYILNNLKYMKSVFGFCKIKSLKVV